jgi:hypothetical protein
MSISAIRKRAPKSETGLMQAALAVDREARAKLIARGYLGEGKDRKRLNTYYDGKVTMPARKAA